MARKTASASASATVAPITIDATADIAPTPAKVKSVQAQHRAKLATVTGLGWRLSGDKLEAIAAIRTVGTTPDAVANFRDTFVGAYMGRLFGAAGKFVTSVTATPEAVAFGLSLLAMAGAGAKAPNGVGQRSTTQETQYTSARKAWSRLLSDAGIASPDARGGATRTGSSKVTADKPEIKPPTAADKVSVPAVVNGPAVPKFATPADSLAFLRSALAQWNAGNDASKRAQHPMLSELYAEITGAVDACADAIGAT